jgi:hypothetical protein
MALALNDRVQQQGTANTTVSFTLTASVAGFQSFAVIGNGNTTYYSATDAAGNWEVGIGTYSTTGPTLTRNTILSSSNSNTAVTFVGTVNVFVTYPSSKSVNLDSSSNVSALGTVSSGTWQGSTIGVAYGGTGVTTSSGANSVMLRDANQNVAVNRLNQSNTNTSAAGGVTALTTASSYIHTLSGTGNQTYTMPDATTLSTGVAFLFNNMATGTLTLQDYATGSIGTIPSGGAGAVFLTVNATVGGTWDLHAYLPEGVTFGTNAFNLGTSVITGGTWNGGTIGTAYGGTGLTSFSAANYALYSTSSSALTAGTLPVAAGGTAATTFTANGVVYGNGTSALGVTAAGTTGQVLIGNTGSAPTWGTISSSLVSSFQTSLSGLTPSTATTGAVTLAGTLGPTSGGTGISSYAVGDLLFANTTTSLDRIPVGTNGYVLTSNGTAPAWSAIPSNVASFQTSLSGLTPSTATTGAVTLAGTLGISSGGTGQTTATAAFDALNPMTTVGDIIYEGTGPAAARLPIGSTSQVLTVVGGVPAWATPSSGGVTTISFGSTGLTPSTATSGAVTVAGTLGPTSGGTGQSTYATGDILYASASNTLAKLTAGTNGQVLTLASGVPSWAASTSSGVSFVVTDFVATAAQTTFTVTYTVGLVEVYRNGVKLAIADYTASNGTTIVLATGANAGDVIEVVAFGSVNTAAVITAEDFNGTGSQTAFTMSVTPANSASVIIAISGVVQDPSTYTVSGTTLTFSTAPPAGTDNISCRYLALPTTTTGTGAVINATNGIIINNQTISASYTIPVGSNAMSTGPVTAASGVTVTVSAGSRYIVI